MPLWPRKVTDEYIRSLITESGAGVGWGTTALGTGDGSNRTFNLPHSGVSQLIVIVDGVIQPPSVYSISAGTGPGGVDQLIFSIGNAPASTKPVEAAGTHS